MRDLRFAIAIPARYGSTRFPGKPLAMINGKTMLSRVIDQARKASAGLDNVEIFVATDDERIAEHAKENGITALMTPESCATGTDRVLSALRQLEIWPDFIINLQGDAPFTPPTVIKKILQAFIDDSRTEVVTPVFQLDWALLDKLREAKKITPFSGTTAIIDEKKRALWFSKSILPVMRNEKQLRETEERSPVFQHIGLYGFRVDILEKFCRLPQSTYEMLEGLEQLRLLENGIHIQTVFIDPEDGHIRSGIDSPEDIARAEQFITDHGDPSA